MREQTKQFFQTPKFLILTDGRESTIGRGRRPCRPKLEQCAGMEAGTYQYSRDVFRNRKLFLSRAACRLLGVLPDSRGSCFVIPTNRQVANITTNYENASRTVPRQAGLPVMVSRLHGNAGIQSGKNLTGFDTSADLDFLDSRFRGNDGEGASVCCGSQNPCITVKQPLFYTLSLLSPFERVH